MQGPHRVRQHAVLVRQAGAPLRLHGEHGGPRAPPASPEAPPEDGGDLGTLLPEPVGAVQQLQPGIGGAAPLPRQPQRGVHHLQGGFHEAGAVPLDRRQRRLVVAVEARQGCSVLLAVVASVLVLEECANRHMAERLWGVHSESR
jgi:hypothetical protein